MMLSTIQPIGSSPVKPPSMAALPAISAGMPYAKMAIASAASRPSAGREVRLQVQEAEADQHHHHRDCCEVGRDDHAPERVVDLLPDHGVLPSLKLSVVEGSAGTGMTVSVRMPCAPRTSTPSMSAVAEGPVISTA